MTDLNTQYAAWLEKNSELFRKWQNAISPPPAQESPGDFRDEEKHPRELKKHKQSYPHNHWDNVKSPLPTGKYLGSGGSQHMKKGGPGSGKKGKQEYEPWYKKPLSSGSMYRGPYGNKSSFSGVVTKGLRGPKKGSTYRKQGAKFYEDVEPRQEKNLPPATQRAISQYKITRQPQDYQKIVSEMRRTEPQPKYWEQEAKELKHPVQLNAMLKQRLMKALVK